MIDKPALNRVPIHDLIARRWSGRAFDPDKPVSIEQIQSMLEAARWAPSCYGDQPWRFIVCDKTGNTDAWEKAFQCLSEGNQIWAQHAPVLILVCAHKQFSHNGSDNRWAEYDTGAATMSLVLQATAQGLMVHQMGGYDVNKTNSDFLISGEFQTMAMVAVGYQLEESDLTAEQKERELSERKRSEPATLFYEGNMDKAFDY